MNKELTVNPCINVCKSDPITDYCYGCGRSSEDKKLWNQPDTSEEWKRSNIELLKDRLTGWQKEAWEKSYYNKKTKGNSLLKEKILNQKK